MTNLTVKIDFNVVESNDPKYLIVGDHSRWGVADKLPANILILPPGSESWINISFLKHNLNVFQSLNLGLDCKDVTCEDYEYSDLDDGIWEIKLESAYQDLNKKRYYLKTDRLRIDIDKLYIKAGIDYDESSTIIKDLRKIEHSLSASKAYIRRGDHNQAMRAFEMASKLTEKQLNCRNCY